MHCRVCAISLIADNKKSNTLCKKCYRHSYYLRHRQLEIDRSAAWAEANPAAAARAKIKHRVNNYGAYIAYNGQRKAKRLKSQPAWADQKALDAIYIARPKGYEVDHIIPLQGDGVCGLHVPWNLQYLTREENRSKGNSYSSRELTFQSTSAKRQV